MACHWLTETEIRALGKKLRSPLVLECLDDYLSGVRLPLTTLKDRRKSSQPRRHYRPRRRTGRETPAKPDTQG